jgi:hypothetical protein
LSKLAQHVELFAAPFKGLSDGWRGLVVPGEEGVGMAIPENAMFPWCPIYAEEFGYDLDLWEVQREHLFSLAWAIFAILTILQQGREVLLSRVSIIRERGMKVRSVTPQEAAVAHFGGYLNSYVLNLMEHDVRLNKSPIPSGEIFVSPGQVVRSVDLTRASDMIPGSVFKAILTGIARGQGWPEAAVKVVNVLTYVVRFDEGYSSSGQPLMGAGLTWPALSLYNLWLSMKVEPSYVKVKGDDALLVCSRRSVREYDRFLSETGGTVSVRKDTTSRFGGCFLEECFVVQSGLLERKKTFSLGCLSQWSRVDRDIHEGLTLPRWALGPGLPQEKVFVDLIPVCFRREFRILRNYRLHPHLPRVLGGPGFPGTPEQVRAAVVALGSHWSRAIRCVIAQMGLDRRILLASLEVPWYTTFAQVHAEAWTMTVDRYQEYKVEFGEERKIGHLSSYKSVDRFLYKEVSGLSSGFGLALGFEEVRHRTPRLSNIVRDIRKSIDKLNQLVPYPRLTDRVSNLTDGVTAFCAEMEETPLRPIYPQFLPIGSAFVGQQPLNPVGE